MVSLIKFELFVWRSLGMLSIILMALLDVFDDCEILFFSAEERDCVMDADIDVTGEIEFLDGVKFDVIWFRELIDVDIVDIV